MHQNNDVNNQGKKEYPVFAAKIYLEQTFCYFKNFTPWRYGHVSARSNASFGGKILTSMSSEILAAAPDDFRFILSN